MWRLVSVLCALTVLAAFPANVSAQADEEGASSEPAAQEFETEKAADEGVMPPEEFVSSPASESEVPDIDALSQRAVEHYEIHYGRHRGDVRVKGPRAGLAVSAGLGVLSIALSGGWIACVNHKESSDLEHLFPPECNPLLGFGFALGLTSAVGMITSGAILGARKRKLRELEQARGAAPRRVQWDLAQSRLVF